MYRAGALLLWIWIASPMFACAGGIQAGDPGPADGAVRLLRSFRFDTVRKAVEHMAAAFGPTYSQGSAYLAQLADLETSCRQLLASYDGGDDTILPQLARAAGRLDALRREALLGNPLLAFDRLLVVKRAYRLPADPSAGKKAGSPRRNPWQYNERLEGEALGLPVNHNSIFSIARRGYDNEIAVISPVRPGGKATTLFRPKDTAFVGEVDLDFAARRLLFTMPQEDRWQVFELDADGSGPLRITPADEPDVDNYDACYLADGRILFCSTANYQSVPCWNGLHNIASLYLLDRQSGKIRQLTFDQDDDNYPSILNTGRILFTRWEYANIPHFFGRLLFSMNPDGTDQREYYGSNSYWPNAIYFARPVPGHPTKVAAIVSGHHGDFRMGNLVILDPAQGRRRAEGLVFRMPDDWSQHLDKQNRYPDGVTQPFGYGSQGEPVVRDRLTSHDWPKFLHPFPLDENFILVSAKPSPQADWGIYLVDTFGNMTLVYQEQGYSILEPIPFCETPRPPVIAERVDLAQKHGTVYLQDIYQGPGLEGVWRGAVKKLRVFAYDFGYRGLGGFDKIGIDGPWDVMRIIGTVPVDEDGSAAFRVPANTPLSVQPLDERGRALQQMRSWFTVMPGEVKSCVGCHETQNSTPLPRGSTAMVRAPREISPWYGPPRGFDFEREVQPVLDKHCAGCHDGSQTVVRGRSKPDLRASALRPDYEGILTNVPQWYDPGNLPTEWNGDLMRIGQRKHVPIRFTPAYEALIRYVRRTGPEGDYHLLEPAEFYADTSVLIQLLEKGHHGVELDPEDWDRLVTWIDLNVPCHGTWSDVLPIPFNGAQRKRELLKKYAGVDYDPEKVSEIPSRRDDPVPARPVKIVAGDRKAPGWPFDSFEARLRQQAPGAARARTIRLGDGPAMKLVRIPAGEFIMGDAEAGSPGEWPQKRIRIERSFWMSACEVTNEQFALFDPGHDSRFERAQKMNVHSRGYPLNEPRQPVVRVTWQQAKAFCAWLTELTGEPFTLPSEAQWEYGCRAGSAEPMWWGWFTDDFSERANLADRSILGFTKWDFSPLNQIYNGWMPLVKSMDDGAMVTAEVGRYVPNPWGLHDMHGNAAEWTSSLYRPYPYDPDDGREDLAAQGERVVRGGSWSDLPQFATAATRFGYPEWRKIHNVGFRVVCPVSDVPQQAGVR